MAKKIIVLAAALVLIAAGYYILERQRATEPEEAIQISSPSDAIPAIDGVSAYMLVQVDDTDSLHSAMSYLPVLADAIGRLPLPNGTLGEPPDARRIAEAVDFLSKARELVGAADAMALYVASADVPAVYVSMFVDDEKFDPLVADGDRQLTRMEEWTGRAGDGGAWILNQATPEGDALYMTRRHIGDKSVVNISGEEEGLDAMLAAVSDPSKRVIAERRTEETNFFRIKLEEPAGMGEWFVGETELSWSRSDEHVAIRWFSDMFEDISGMTTSGNFEPAPPPILGDGELAMLASADPMFFIHTMFPNEEDPAKAFFERFGMGITAQFAGELEAIMRECRISAAVVTNGDAVSTAYLVIDTAAERALDRLYGMASLFLGSGRELAGWDSILNIPTGTPINAIAARRGGTILIGVGDFEEYTRSAKTHGNLETVTSKSNVFGITAVPGRLNVSEGFLASMLRAGVLNFLEPFLPFAELGDNADLDWVDHFTATQSMNGGIGVDIYLRK